MKLEGKLIMELTPEDEAMIEHWKATEGQTEEGQYLLKVIDDFFTRMEHHSETVRNGGTIKLTGMSPEDRRSSLFGEGRMK